MTESELKPASDASRVLLGFALAPLLPGFYATLFFAQPWAFPIGLGLSYPTALLVGLPLFLGFRRQGWLAWWQMMLCGLLASLPLLLLYRLHGAPPHLQDFDWFNALVLEGWGAFTGLVFWLLAIAGAAPPSLRILFGFGLGI
jgi:hypothetical protein